MAGILRDLAAKQALLAGSVKLAESAMASGVLRDAARYQAGLGGFMLPQVKAFESAMACGVLRDAARYQAGLAGTMLPQLKLAESFNFSTVSAIFRDLATTQSPLANLLRQMNSFVELSGDWTVLLQPQESFDVEPRTALSSEQQRMIFARYICCLTLSLVLLAYLKILSEGEIGSEVVSLLAVMSGLGGHQVAKFAYNTAFRLFDYLRPPE